MSTSITTTTPDNIVEVQGYKFDVTGNGGADDAIELPVLTVARAIKRAFGHVLGNEVASWVNSQIESKEGLTDDEKKSETAKLTKERRDYFVKMFLDAEWNKGERGGPTGPRLVGADAIFEREVAGLVRARLAELVKNGEAVYNKEAKNWTLRGGKVVELAHGVTEYKNSTNPVTVAQREALRKAAEDKHAALSRKAETASSDGAAIESIF